MTDPFNRNKTIEAKLGQLITEPGAQNQRDAIHIAVVPVMASTDLRAGQHVGVSADGLRSLVGSGDPVGIVDPFMPAGVKAGESFWLCLYQGSVHTLRHEWTHPAFPEVAARPADQRAASEVWLRAFAMRIKPYDDRGTAYENFLRELVEGEVFFHGTDTDYSITSDAELWRHVAIVTGRQVDTSDLSLRCSC